MVVDVLAELPEPGAVLIYVTGAVDADAKAGRWRGGTDMALGTVEVILAWHPAIHAGSVFAGEARYAIIGLVRGLAARADPDADAALGARTDRHAIVVTRIGAVAVIDAGASARRLALFDRRAAIRVAS
jgi:hypothetical protein